MKYTLILFISLFTLFSCQKDKEQQQKNNAIQPEEKTIKTTEKDFNASGFKEQEILKTSYENLDSLKDQKIALKGNLTGEKFEHLVYFHPPYSEIAHFNLSSQYSFYSEMPHIVIYFKRNTDLSKIYTQFLDKPAIIYGTLGKVSGAMTNIDPEKVKKRLEHTLYFLDVEKISAE